MMAANRILFMGSKALGLRVLREMYSLSPKTLIGVLTTDDTDDIRSERKAIEQFSKENNVPFYEASSRVTAEQMIIDIRPDFCVVVGWYWLIGHTARVAVPRGFVGIHNSPLPKYRGGSPLVWSIINGEKSVGVSLFTIEAGMDEGDIWAQKMLAVGENDTIRDVLARLEDLTIDILREVYIDLINGKATSIKQHHEHATYCAMRMPSDGKIDWGWSSAVIYNFIRAQSEPYPGAFTCFNGKKIIIWKAVKYAMPYYGTAGQVARVCKEGVFVICGDNRAIVIKEVEVDGVRMAAEKVLKSITYRLYGYGSEGGGGEA